MIYPTRKVYITQKWGVNPSTYSRFGFKGHNGIDLRIYNNEGVKALTGDLIAPHDGEIIEARMDANGYGWYYKIENGKEGSILAHNSMLLFGVGHKVKEGDVIGRTGNTGWSTGAHVHWGYYRFPRDRQNGYGGTINQVPLLEGKEDMEEGLMNIEIKDFEKLMREAKEKDTIIESLTKENEDRKEYIETLEKHECTDESIGWILTGKKVIEDDDGGITTEVSYKPDTN